MRQCFGMFRFPNMAAYNCPNSFLIGGSCSSNISVLFLKPFQIEKFNPPVTMYTTSAYVNLQPYPDVSEKTLNIH